MKVNSPLHYQETPRKNNCDDTYPILGAFVRLLTVFYFILMVTVVFPCVLKCAHTLLPGVAYVFFGPLSFAVLFVITVLGVCFGFRLARFYEFGKRRYAKYEAKVHRFYEIETRRVHFGALRERRADRVRRSSRCRS